MNLDKLKELEVEATTGKIGINGAGSIVGGNKVLFFFNNEQIKVGKFDEDLARAQLMCALRNSAKEMIETIERYKTALEKIREGKYENGLNREPFELRSVAKEALKDPEKDSQPNIEDQPTN